MTALMSIIAVAAGGALGAVMRFALARRLDYTISRFPLGTFAANMIASALLGFCVAFFETRPSSQTAEIFMEAGFCATLSTFSSLAWQITEMVRSKNFALCAVYTCATFLFGILLFALAANLL